ncbi:MAG TPA: cytochrome c biogenesis protein CcsA [Cyclobacteriaceae bacterium]|jgi:cytochrome c-type biogenesis protein CcmF|nr:cytochrome c biogenesis protein CcsA [Cytophagales bacterium]HRE67444.1 cytochrome c biogenesis protein CcsA [Cyclobacteriaceae bacterium]HRF33467.1 cytochrome c biogenesis protein CcsA [Cyclobacteriaceae bacterium]
MHYFIGDLGHFFIILSFVTSLISAFAYWKTINSPDETREPWRKNARVAFYTHLAAVLGVVVCLFVIIYQHYFEYHYAYSHSSRHLPGQYMVSCFWEGQEGSFLLWIFWQALIGIVLIHSQKKWEAPVMVVFSLVQAFLASMILGVVIPLLDIKLGSSPFILLRDAIDDPIFSLQPDFIPKDGSGLNPLLQNYWMVIHPPTLFLGFALTLVPFAFCIAGLWQKQYSEWIKPALPWTLLGAGILGLGILMGGYWAYETLNFGGYWNWDPVENAVYVPWLVMIASIHTMIIYKNNQTALKSSIILAIAVFVLILYSTFLTRSGILGDASVHSFTDLGLSGQLLIYLLFFTVAAIALAAWHWKHIPSSEKETEVYSREFWIFLGATILCFSGFHVIIPTSYPVINEMGSWFGLDLRLAVPGNQVEYYSRYQIWFGVLVALASGTAQFFWWRKIDKHNLVKELLYPVLISLVVFALIISLAKIYKPAYLVLTLAGVYLIVSNLKVLFTVSKVKKSLSGGAISHLGVGLMLIGIMFSAGYSSVVSLNNTGMLISKDLPTEFNRDNLLLFINETRVMAGYEIEYLGERVKPNGIRGYVSKNDIDLTFDPYQVIATKDIYYNNKKILNARDTFEINPENTFYEVELRKNGKVEAVLFPRVQINPAMGGFVASPDIERHVGRDLYTHVSLPMNREEEPEWSEMSEERIRINQEFFVNDYVAVLEEVVRIHEIDGYILDETDVAVKAKIKVKGERDEYFAEPIFLIREKSQVGRIASEINDLGVKITLLNIHPDTNDFSLGINTRQKDWVIIKAIEMPLINVLWLGTGVLMVGFTVAMVRRFKDFRKEV